MKKLTLEQLIEVGKSAPVDGDFGLTACKKEIQWFLDRYHQNDKEQHLYVLLGLYVERANTKDLIFHATNVYACWLLINEN